MPKFNIARIMAPTVDIQRTYLFEITIPGMDKYGIVDEELTIRTRSAVIPGRSTKALESVYMGMKRFYPSVPEFSHSLAVNYEEFEDRKVSTAMYKWQQDMFDIVDTAAALQPNKASIVKDITLEMLDYKGTPLTNSGKILFVNAWLQNFGEVAVSYADQASVTYTATFQYDYWKFI